MDESSSPEAMGIEQVAKNLNEYEVIKPLGKGGMGIIYLVRQRLTNRLEVLKVLRPELATRPRLKERFLREVQVAARLDHPNIVKTYTAIDRGFLGLVIEYVPGMDLDSMVRKLGPLRLEYAMAILAQTARGLGTPSVADWCIGISSPRIFSSASPILVTSPSSPTLACVKTSNSRKQMD